jgi:integrase/recombinase XerD
MVSSQAKNQPNFAAPKANAKLDVVKKMVRIARQHRLNYDDFVYVCQQVRLKLKLKKPKKERRLPELLSAPELKKFFRTVEKCGDLQHELLLKLLLYTAVRVSELVNMRVQDVHVDDCKIFIDSGKGKKDRYILFPSSFQLALRTYLDSHSDNVYLFESRLNQPYTARRIQQIVRMYADEARLNRTVHPHLLRHQMLTFLTGQGLSDAKIQLLSGHENRKSLELYQHLSLESVENEYQQAVRNLGV